MIFVVAVIFTILVWLFANIIRLSCTFANFRDSYPGSSEIFMSFPNSLTFRKSRRFPLRSF